MPTQLLLPGVNVTAAPMSEPRLAAYLNVEILHTKTVDPTARGGPGAQELVDAEESDIVELEWENGVREWISVAQLREDYPELARPRGAAEEALTVPPFRKTRARERMS